MRSHKKIRWSAFLAGVSVMAMAGSALADRFDSWAEMEATGCYDEGWSRDFEVERYHAQGACIGGTCYHEDYLNNLVLAIHGGNVEKWTDDLAYEVALYYPECVTVGYSTACAHSSLYNLVVHVDESETCDPENGGSSFTKDDKDLHITATNFDEWRAEDYVEDAYSIVSIHGLANDSYGDTDKNVVCVGGQNESMRDDFISQVNGDSLLSGILRAEDSTLPSCEDDDTIPCTYCPDYATGTASSNIVNEGTNPNGGLQLEFTYKARQDLFNSANFAKRKRLVEITQDVMLNESAEVQ